MRNHETKLFSLINPSLEVVYYSTTLSNHGPIRLKRFVPQLHPGYGMSFVSYPHSILLISGQTFEVSVALKKFWDLNKALLSDVGINALVQSKCWTCYLMILHQCKNNGLRDLLLSALSQFSSVGFTSHLSPR